MRKLTSFILIAVALMSLSVYAVDIQGQGDTTTVSEMVVQVWDDLWGYTAAPQTITDTSFTIRMLNDAALETAHDWLCVERDTIISVSADSEDYDLPPDFYRILWVESASDSTNKFQGMIPMSGDQIGYHRTEGSTPRYYLVYKHKLHIEPIGDTTTTARVRVRYAANSNKLDSLDDTTNIGKEFVKYLTLTAEINILTAVQARGAYQPVIDNKLKFIAVKRDLEKARIDGLNKSVLERLAK